jgi:hypothetical protein
MLIFFFFFKVILVRAIVFDDFFEIPTSWFNRIMDKSLENQNWDELLGQKCYAEF